MSNSDAQLVEALATLPTHDLRVDDAICRHLDRAPGDEKAARFAFLVSAIAERRRSRAR